MRGREAPAAERIDRENETRHNDRQRETVVTVAAPRSHSHTPPTRPPSPPSARPLNYIFEVIRLSSGLDVRLDGGDHTQVSDAGEQRHGPPGQRRRRRELERVDQRAAPAAGTRAGATERDVVVLRQRGDRVVARHLDGGGEGRAGSGGGGLSRRGGVTSRAQRTAATTTAAGDGQLHRRRAENATAEWGRLFIFCVRSDQPSRRRSSPHESADAAAHPAAECSQWPSIT